MFELKKRIAFLPIILLPIFAGILKMEIFKAVTVTVLTSLILVIISYFYRILTRKCVRSHTIYERDFIRIIFWNANALRSLYSYDFGEKGFEIRVNKEFSISEIKDKADKNLKKPNFSCDIEMISENKCVIFVENFPAKNILEFHVYTSPKQVPANEGVFLKNGLLCLPEKQNYDNIKPIIHLNCDNTKINYAEISNIKGLERLRIIFAVLVIIGEILVIIFSNVLKYSLFSDPIIWSTTILMGGIFGLAVAEVLPPFVKKYLERNSD